jgi:hypothetical protein
MGLRLPLGGTRDRGPRAPSSATTWPRLSATSPRSSRWRCPAASRLQGGVAIEVRSREISVAKVARSSPYVKAISFSLAEALSRVGGVTAQQQETLRGTCYGDLGSGIHAACGDPGERLQVARSDPGADFCTRV